MKLHTSEELRNYCDSLEQNKRMGALFWRKGFGIESKDQARAILASDLDNYLRPAMRNLAEVLIVRSSIAADDVKKDLHKHLCNAFPTLKSVGMVVRKGNNAKPTKAFSDVPDTTVTVSKDLENGLTFSACISWRYADTKDITDNTIESLPMIGESAPSQAGIDPTIAMPKSQGTRIDLAYTPDAVSKLLVQVDSQASRNASKCHAIAINALIELAISCVPGYDGAGPSIAKMFPMAETATSQAIDVSTSRNARNASRTSRKMTA